jgi:hypothetical protein
MKRQIIADATRKWPLLIFIECHPIRDRVTKDFPEFCFIKHVPNELQRSRLMNVLPGWRNRNHLVSRNQVEHICLQDQCENPETHNDKSALEK